MTVNHRQHIARLQCRKVSVKKEKPNVNAFEIEVCINSVDNIIRTVQCEKHLGRRRRIVCISSDSAGASSQHPEEECVALEKKIPDLRSLKLPNYRFLTSSMMCGRVMSMIRSATHLAADFDPAHEPGAGGNLDDGLVDGVAVHALCGERAMGCVEEGDVGVLHFSRAVVVRVGAQAAVDVSGDADAVVCLAEAEPTIQQATRVESSPIVNRRRRRDEMDDATTVRMRPWQIPRPAGT